MKNEPQSQELLYQTSDGAAWLEVRLEDDHERFIRHVA